MRTRRWLITSALAGLGASLLPMREAQAGLFDDDKKIASGDIKDIDYWKARWNMDRMEEAIKSRQPEGAIAVEVGGTLRMLEDLMKTYPQHTGLKKWYEHAQAIEKKIDPNANRTESFREGCLWAEGDYKMAYAAMNAARMAAAEKNWEQARDWSRLASENLGFLQRRIEKSDRVANWPPEFVTWIKTSQPEVDKLRAEVKAHVR